jgi:nicotinamidase-related amidase
MEVKGIKGEKPPDSAAALLLIDMISDFEFDDGAALLRHALPMSKRLAALRARTREAGIPNIYVNDNFGHWTSDFRSLVERCLKPDVDGSKVVGMLVPSERDYFVLKPKHSAFFSTTLATLLEYLRIRRLILTGVAADICVQISAADAYMRDYQLFVPADCVAATTERARKSALDYMQRVLGADIRNSAALDLAQLRRRSNLPVRKAE